jgi:ABC-type transport system substrate-binding protein
MKKAQCIILSLVISLSLLSGCKSPTTETTKDPNADPIKGTSIKFHLPEDPDTLSPWISEQGGRMSIIPCIYQSLFNWSDDFTGLDPVIAESYEHTDANHTTIKIKDSVYDSAGNQIKGSDVAFSVNSAITAGVFAATSIMDNCVATGDLEVKITWNIDIADSLSGFTEAIRRIYIVNQAAYEAVGANYSSKPIGTGPYVVSEALPGATYTLKRSDNYWQSGEDNLPATSKANVDQITFVVITEQSQQAVALETGVVDIVGIPTADLYLFEEGGANAADFTLKMLNSLGGTLLKFNCAENINTSLFANYDSIDYSNYTSPCSNINFRKALAYSFDINEIIKGVYLGRAAAMNSYGGNLDSADYNKEWDNADYYGVNLDKAKEYLAIALKELGKKEAKDISIILHCRANDIYRTMATILANSFQKLGIGCTIDTTDIRFITLDPTTWDVELKDLIASPSFTTLTWADAYGDVAWSDRSVQGVYNWCYIHDDKLEEFSTVGRTAGGYSKKLVEDAREYVIFEKCYQLMLTCSETPWGFRTDSFVDVVFNFANYPLPQACTYTWNL